MIVTLKDITTKITKGTTPTSIGCKFEKSGINFIKSESLVDGKTIDKSKFAFISERTHERLKRSQIEENDILFSMAGMFLGKTGIATAEVVPANTNQAVAIIRVDDTKANYEYVYYYLNQKSVIHTINTTSAQSAQPNINLKQIGKIKINLPDRKKQDQIVSLLSAIDLKISNNVEINDNLEQQAVALFKSWFVDFSLFGGTVPENWEDTTLENITTLITRGIAPKYSDNSDQTVVNQKCIRNHTIDLSLARTHTPKAINEKWLKFGDLLINSTGDGTLGRVAQVWFTPKALTVDSHVTIVRPAREELIFYIGLWGILHEKEIESLHTGSTGQTELPRDRVKMLKLLLPDNISLSRFNSIITPMASTIISNQEENQKLASLRDTLLPKFMSGEIDVSNIQF